jgi:NADH dehydrogenase
MAARTVLVTGATGYVGRRLVPALAAAGHTVRVLVRDPSTANVPDGVTVMQGDVTDPRSLGPAFAGVEVVVNLAAITADQKAPKGGYDTVNADGPANVVGAAKDAGVGRIVQMGGIDTVAGTPGPYLAGRRRGEQAVIESGIPWAILQPSIMFGGSDAAFPHAMADLIRKAPIVPVPGDGSLRLQLVWVEDVARCLVALVEDDAKTGKFPVGGPEELTYDAQLDVIGAAIGKTKVRKIHLPMGFMRLQARLMSILPHPPLTPAALELFAGDNVAGVDAIPRQFGFEPRSFREHLAQHGLDG